MYYDNEYNKANGEDLQFIGDFFIYSVGTEMDFAKALEIESDVVVYTKLPGGFYINTPVGHYNPD